MTVRVHLGERSYDIVIQTGCLPQLGQHLEAMGFSGKIGIVSNPTVFKLYGPSLMRSLKAAGYQCMSIILPDSEKAKTLQSVATVLDALVKKGFERKSLLVALGGGVVGDITGFAAAIYLRGIPFVQVATTLVAQVDSSVGGKTGVNHPLGKNLIGAFYQPSLVMLDIETLRTLPDREWIAGLAEVIKYGMIADETFFRYLEQHLPAILAKDSDCIQHVVKRCCEIKAQVVEQDEREEGVRRILNYGHTIGHALEAWGKYRTYVHGEAVGLGMVCEAEVGHYLGYCSTDVVSRQKDIVARAGLPSTRPPIRFSALWSSMLHDKKVAQGAIHCVVPRTVGKVEVIRFERDPVKKWFGEFWKGRESKPRQRMRRGSCLP